MVEMILSRLQLVIGTRNAGKAREITSALSDLPLSLRTLDEFPEVSEPVELDRSYDENARIKAEAYASEINIPVLADDSGLEVESLGKLPGILSARYGGANLSDDDRVQVLLRELGSQKNRKARFQCAIAIAGFGEYTIVYGTCKGRIAAQPRGQGGFGYDPVFIPDGFDRTFAELPIEIKQRISHRAHALCKAKDFLKYALLLLAN